MDRKIDIWINRQIDGWIDRYSRIETLVINIVIILISLGNLNYLSIEFERVLSGLIHT